MEKAIRRKRDWQAIKEEFITGDDPSVTSFFKKKTWN
jgi:hypothetical protein